MPKPSSLPAWNTAGTNRTIPPGGVQSAGHPVNDIPSSSYENWYKNLVYQWAVWANDGTSAIAATAHIVETDAAGHTGLVGLEIEGDDAAAAALTVSNPVGVGDGVAIEATGSAGGAAMIATGGPGAPALIALGGTSDQPGVDAIGGGEGAGVRGTGGDDGGPGVIGTGTGGEAGVEGVADDSGPGVYAMSGTSSGEHAAEFVLADGGAASDVQAIRATSLDNDGIAILAAAFTNSTTAAAAIQANGGSNPASAAACFRAVASAGYCLDTNVPSSPVRAHIHLEPVDNDPTTLDNGDIWAMAAVGPERGLYIREGGVTRGVWATAGGIVDALGESRAQSSTSSGAMQNKVTAAITAKRAGVVRLHAVAEVGNSNSGQVNIDIYDVTDSVVIETREINCRVNSSDADERDVVIETSYTLPAAGARTFALRYCDNAGDTSRIREASLRVQGVF